MWFVCTARNAFVVAVCTAVAYLAVGPADEDGNGFRLTGEIDPGMPQPRVPSFNVEYTEEGNARFRDILIAFYL